jgi:hypothetical protein
MFDAGPTSVVAQICNLPYRRIASCKVSERSALLEFADALPITNRRYGRLQICATLNTSVARRFGWLAPASQTGIFEHSLRPLKPV